MGTALEPTTARQELDLPPEMLNATKALVDRANARQLPLDVDGNIEGYWDPTTLSEDYEEPTLIPLSYVEGFPTTPQGTPFWERLENEPMKYYEAFKKYRDYPYTTITASSATQASNLTKSRLAQHKRRTLAKVAELLKVNPATLNTIAALYCWQYRASAYDKFREQEQEIQLRADSIEMELTHAGLARRLIDKVAEALEDMDPEELTPQMMNEWLKNGVALERLSRGKEPSKPTNGDGKHPANDQKPGVSIGNNQGTVQVQVIYTDDWRSS
jgi:hypothetical protein